MQGFPSNRAFSKHLETIKENKKQETAKEKGQKYPNPPYSYDENEEMDESQKHTEIEKKQGSQEEGE